jgi:hypothetical protein
MRMDGQPQAPASNSVAAFWNDPDNEVEVGHQRLENFICKGLDDNIHIYIYIYIYIYKGKTMCFSNYG